MHLHEYGSAWYALQVRRRFEKIVSRTLHSKGYDEFLPLYHGFRRSSEGTKQIELPLFPGYVFCRFDFLNRLQILTVPGVNAVAGFGPRVTPIAESELDSLRTVLNSGRACAPCPFIADGTRARVESGPLAGTEGFVTALDNKLRLVVSVTMIQRSLAVDVESETLKTLPEVVPAHNFETAKYGKREMLVS